MFLQDFQVQTNSQHSLNNLLSNQTELISYTRPPQPNRCHILTGPAQLQACRIHFWN